MQTPCHPARLFVQVVATIYPCCVSEGPGQGWCLGAENTLEGAVWSPFTQMFFAQNAGKLQAPASPVKNLSVFSIPSCISYGLRIDSQHLHSFKIP